MTSDRGSDLARQDQRKMRRISAENERKIGGTCKHVVGKTAEWACTMEDGVPCLSFPTHIPDMGRQFCSYSLFCLAGEFGRVSVKTLTIRTLFWGGRRHCFGYICIGLNSTFVSAVCIFSSPYTLSLNITLLHRL